MASRNIKDFVQVIASQIIGVVASIVRSLILPLYLGVINFGYFQSYLFYVSLLPLITLGYNDGVYLKYGKFDYNDLPKEQLSSSNFFFVILLFLLDAVVVFVSFLTINDPKLFLIIILSCIYGFFLGINSLIMQLLQVTRQFKKYSIASIATRILSLAFILIILLLNGSYIGLIIADLVSFIIVTLFIVQNFKELFFSKIKLAIGYKEFSDDLKNGFPLLIAGLIGLIYLGGGRFIVQVFGGIEKFSYYSFAISLASFVSIAISSASMVVYPIIARSNESSKIETYVKINSIIRILVVFIPCLYYAAYFLVSYAYIEYISILQYLGMVFIMMYIQSFISILHNTYYKALRLEKQLMKDNFYSVISLFAIGFPLYYFTRDIIWIALTTLIAFVFRYVISMIRLKKNFSKDIKYNVLELIFSSVFIICTTLTSKQPLIGIVIMAIITIIYTYVSKSDFWKLKALFS